MLKSLGILFIMKLYASPLYTSQNYFYLKEKVIFDRSAL